MIEQRLKHGRHAWQRRRAGPGDGREHLGRIEARQHHDLAAMRHGAIEHAGIGEDMEERQHAQDPVGHAGIGIDRIDLPGIGRNVLMREHRALGPAGGAAGILDEREILLGVERRQALLGGRAHEIGEVQDAPVALGHRRVVARLEHPVEQPLARRQRARDRADDQPLDAARLQHLLRGDEQLLRADGDQQPRAAVLGLVRQFLGGVERREIDHDGAGHERAIISRDIMGDVGKIEPDPVALADAEADQRVSEPPRAIQHLGIAVAPTVEIDQRGAGDWRLRRRTACPAE